MSLDEATLIIRGDDGVIDAVRQRTGLTLSDDAMWELAEGIYDRSRMAARDVRRLRDAAAAARDAYERARDVCRHDEVRHSPIAPFTRRRCCIGCGKWVDNDHCFEVAP